jgi:cell division protein FtsB
MAKRPQLTGRAAILAVVVCAIALSLAYPVREYIAQRRQIAQLQQQKNAALEEIKGLEQRRQQQEDPGYIKQQARERLYFCDVGVKCFVVMGDQPGAQEPVKALVSAQEDSRLPWYQTLWESVQAADRGTGKPAAGSR